MSAARRWEKDEGGDASAARPVAIVLIVGLVRMAGFFIATCFAAPVFFYHYSLARDFFRFLFQSQFVFAAFGTGASV